MCETLVFVHRKEVRDCRKREKSHTGFKDFIPKALQDDTTRMKGMQWSITAHDAAAADKNSPATKLVAFPWRIDNEHAFSPDEDLPRIILRAEFQLISKKTHVLFLLCIRILCSTLRLMQESSLLRFCILLVWKFFFQKQQDREKAASSHTEILLGRHI